MLAVGNNTIMRVRPRRFVRYTGLLICYCFTSYIFLLIYTIEQDVPSWADRKTRVTDTCKKSPVELPKPKLWVSANGNLRNQHYQNLYDTQLLASLVHIEQLNLLWCIVPKVASTSLAIAILKYMDVTFPPSEPPHFEIVRRGGHLSMDTYNRLDPNKTVSFLITRHPLARIASAYRSKLQNRTGSHDGEYFYRTWSKQIIELTRGHWDNNSAEPTFPEFVKFLLSTNIYDYDEHWSPASIRCRVCQIDYKFIVKYERLQTDLPHFLSTTGLVGKIDLPWENSASGDKDYIKNYLSKIDQDDLVQLVDKYRLDMDMFGYKPQDLLSNWT